MLYVVLYRLGVNTMFDVEVIEKGSFGHGHCDGCRAENVRIVGRTKKGRKYCAYCDETFDSIGNLHHYLNAREKKEESGPVRIDMVDIVFHINRMFNVLERMCGGEG